jgi:hypothetical protein
MSTATPPPPHTGPGHGPAIPQESDSPSGRGIVLVVGAAVVISLALAVFSSVVLRNRIAPDRWLPHPAAAAVGEVNQTLIGADTSAAALADRQRQQLEGYGWMIQSEGVVRIPIERAMEIVAAEGAR